MASVLSELSNRILWSETLEKDGFIDTRIGSYLPIKLNPNRG